VKRRLLTRGRAIGSVLAASAALVGAGATSAAADTPTAGELWVCAEGSYSIVVHGRYMVPENDSGAIGLTFHSTIIEPGDPCWKMDVNPNGDIRVNVRRYPNDLSIKTFTYRAHVGLVVKAVDTADGPAVWRYSF
jgi:hypothetical protein